MSIFSKEKRAGKGGSPLFPRRLLLGCMVFSFIASALAGCAGVRPSKSSTEEPFNQTIAEQGKGKEHFLKSLSSTLDGAIEISFSKFLLTDEKEGQAKNELSLAGAKLALAIESLSLHGIDAYLNAPVDYNGSKRGIEATLVDDEIYLSISSFDDNKPYDFRYVADISQTYDDGEKPCDEPCSIDPTTGGTLIYEFGQLDYVLEAIVSTLSENDIHWGIHFDDLFSSSDDSSFDFGSIEEVDPVNGLPYFVWNLSIGEEELSIGLRSDASYSWTGFDFPAISSGAQSTYEVTSSLSLSLQASVEGNKSFAFSVPSDASDYNKIEDSLSLWKEIAKVAGQMAFEIDSYHFVNGVKTNGLLFSHHAEESSDESSIHHDAIDEDAILDISARMAYDRQEKAMDDLFFNLTTSDINSSKTKTVSAVLDGDDLYLNLASILMAKTNWTVLNGLFSSFDDLLSNEDIANEDLSSLFSSLMSFKGFVGDVMDSPLVSGVKDGTYSPVLEAISSLTASANSIHIEIDLSQLSMQGEMAIDIDTNHSSYYHLGSVTLTDAGSEDLKINGVIAINEYSGKVSFDESAYTELSHLPTLSDEIFNLAHSNSAKFTLSGYYAKGGTTAYSKDTNYKVGNSYLSQEGFVFDAQGAFGLALKRGCGTATMIDRKAAFLNEHHIAIEIDGAETKEQKEAADDYSNTASLPNMLFSYDSKNTYSYSGVSGKSAYGNASSNEPDNGTMYGRLSIHSLNGILDLVSDLMEEDDDRFSALFSGVSTTPSGLLGKLLNEEIVPFLTEKVLLSSTTHNGIAYKTEIGQSVDTFVISKDVFDTVNDPVIRLHFGERSNGNKCLSSIEAWIDMSASRDTNDDGNNETVTDSIYLNIGIDICEATENADGTYSGELSASDLQIAALESKRSSCTDYSSIKTLAEYLLGAANLGSNVETDGASTYHLQLYVTLTLPVLSDVNVVIDAYIYVKGTEINAAATIDLPSVSGASQRLLATSRGHRYIELYFHRSSTDDGSILLHRTDVDPTDTNTNNKDWWVRTSASDFMENILPWLLKFIVGANSTVYNLIDDAIEKNDTADAPIHGEDLITQFSFNNNLSNPIWTLGLDIAELVHDSNLGVLSIGLGGKSITEGGKTRKTLATITSLSFPLVGGLITIEQTSGKTSKLANVSTGSYVTAWGSNKDPFNTYSITKATRQKKVLWWTTTETYYYLTTTSTYAKTAFESKMWKNGAHTSFYNGKTYKSTPDNNSY